MPEFFLHHFQQLPRARRRTHHPIPRPGPLPTRVTLHGQKGPVRFVVYSPDGENLVVVASRGGMSTHPGWYLNLQARPIATLEVGPEKFKVRARTARPDEREHFKQVIPYYEQQQRLTTREIPFVVFDRG